MSGLCASLTSPTTPQGESDDEFGGGHGTQYTLVNPELVKVEGTKIILGKGSIKPREQPASAYETPRVSRGVSGVHVFTCFRRPGKFGMRKGGMSARACLPPVNLPVPALTLSRTGRRGEFESDNIFTSRAPQPKSKRNLRSDINKLLQHAWNTVSVDARVRGQPSLTLLRSLTLFAAERSLCAGCAW